MARCTKVAAGLAVAAPATLAVVSLLTAGAASADPGFTYPQGVSYSNATYAGAGSDTIQGVDNAIAADQQNTASTPTFESWDAFNPSTNATYDTIKPKGVAGNAQARPNGSGDGVTALDISRSVISDSATSAYITAHGSVPANSIDFARSSSAPSTTSPASLQWIPFAGDAVTWSYKSGSPLATAQISASDLNAIYACTKTTVNLSGGGTAPVTPALPQANSGTRKFFLKAIGNPTLGSCVVQNNDEENTGTALTDNTRIYPYSVAVYISQVDTSYSVDKHGNAVLGGIYNGTSVIAPTTGSGTSTKINTALPTAFQRLVFNVITVADATGTGTTATDLQKLFKGSSSVVCKDTSAIHNFGFLSLGTDCGETGSTFANNDSTHPNYGAVALQGVH